MKSGYRYLLPFAQFAEFNITVSLDAYIKESVNLRDEESVSTPLKNEYGLTLIETILNYARSCVENLFITVIHRISQSFGRHSAPGS